MTSKGRRAHHMEVQEFELSTRMWITIHRYKGTPRDGWRWYQEHGWDEQAYRVIHAFPPHRLFIEDGKRILRPIDEKEI